MKSVIIYGVDESPPFISLLLLGVQYVLKFGILLICAVLLMRAAGGTPSMVINALSLTLFFSALGTALMACKRGIGAGLFLPMQASVPFFVVSMLAAAHGGMGEVAGMSLFAAVTQLVLTPFLVKWHGIVVRELSGLIILILGVWAAGLGAGELFHPGFLGNTLIHGHIFYDQHINLYSAIPGFISLLMLLVLRLWGRHRVHSILYAIVVGWAVGWLMGTVPTSRLLVLSHMPWFCRPHFFAYSHWHMSVSLMVAFFAVAVFASLEVAALVRTTEIVAGQTPDKTRVIRANLAASLSTGLSGVCGGFIVSVIPGGVGDLISSDVYSRSIAWFYSAILLLLAFMPKIGAFFLTMPAAVNGAVIIFMGAVMVLKGWQMLDFDVMPVLRSKVYGLAIVVGISALVVPSVQKFGSHYFGIFTNAALVYAVVAACVLLLLLRVRGDLYGK
jgi:xanthine permease XanP